MCTCDKRGFACIRISVGAKGGSCSCRPLAALRSPPSLSSLPPLLPLPCCRRSHELQQPLPRLSARESMTWYLQSALQELHGLAQPPDATSCLNHSWNLSIATASQLNAVVTSDLLIAPHKARAALQYDAALVELAEKLVAVWQNSAPCGADGGGGSGGSTASSVSLARVLSSGLSSGLASARLGRHASTSSTTSGHKSPALSSFSVAPSMARSVRYHALPPLPREAAAHPRWQSPLVSPAASRALLRMRGSGSTRPRLVAVASFGPGDFDATLDSRGAAPSDHGSSSRGSVSIHSVAEDWPTAATFETLGYSPPPRQAVLLRLQVRSTPWTCAPRSRSPARPRSCASWSWP
eukprot:365509-Chlamydomonas_euryale.AAC.5